MGDGNVAATGTGDGVTAEDGVTPPQDAWSAAVTSTRQVLDQMYQKEYRGVTAGQIACMKAS